MKIALVHDWLLAQRGGEKVLAELSQFFPEAPIYTLIYKEKLAAPVFARKTIHTSFAQKIPLVHKYYRYLLPFYPAMIEQFDLRDFDIVLSLNHCVAKGVIVPVSTLHISYCFTPMRYIWDQYWQYFSHHPFYQFISKSFIFNYLRIWDITSANRVDKFLAISQFVAQRIQKYYRREATVIYPPVDTEFFTPSNDTSDFFLIVSALVPYKNIDIAIQAFNEAGLPLKIIGNGPEKSRLKRIAKANIEFIGWVEDAVLRDYYRKCKALILPSEEDFGMVAVEAQACGKPVIIYEKGGAIETIVPQQTGISFKNINKNGIINTLNTFSQMAFSPEIIRKHSEKFSKTIFQEKIMHSIESSMNK